MRCACIDVGSNTTRLLVADRTRNGMRSARNERAFTLIGRSIGDGGRIPAEKIAETAAVVAAQAELARELGAAQVRAVATAAIRRAANAAELVTAVADRAELALEVLDGEEEARLAFRGAAHAVGGEGTLAVVDVGGGSTEIAVGDASGAVAGAVSIAVGSALLADRHLRSDPPSQAQIDAARADAAAALKRFEPPHAERVVAVGGSAGSLQRLTGSRLDREQFVRALALLRGETAEALAARTGLDPVRVRLLPAGLLVLAAVGERMRQPLALCSGGLREGVVLEMMDAGGAPGG